jgi:hypothetical protein
VRVPRLLPVHRWPRLADADADAGEAAGRQGGQGPRSGRPPALATSARPDEDLAAARRDGGAAGP